MTEFLTLWAFSSILSIGMDGIKIMEFIKKIGDAGYKFNLNRMTNFVNKFNIYDNKDISQNRNAFSNLIPIYNVAKSVYDANILIGNFDYILETAQTLNIVVPMNEEERKRYEKNKSAFSIINISINDEIKLKEKMEKNNKIKEDLKENLNGETKIIKISDIPQENFKENPLINLLSTIQASSLISNLNFKLTDFISIVSNGQFIYKDGFIAYNAFLDKEYNKTITIIISPDNRVEIKKCTLKRNEKNSNFKMSMSEIKYNNESNSLVAKINDITTKEEKDKDINILRKKYLNIEDMPGKIKENNLFIDGKDLFDNIEKVRNEFKINEEEKHKVLKN